MSESKANCAALALSLLLVSPLTAVSGSGWTNVSPKEAGFTIQMPGAPKPDSKKPGRFSANIGDGSWIVESEELEGAMRTVVDAGDRSGIERILETMRDSTINGMKATMITSRAADFEGSPSIFFTFGGVLEGTAFEGTERVVLAAGRMYSIVAIGSKGTMRKEDVERFFGSFRLTRAAPDMAGPPGTFRTVAYWDAVCRRMPSIPVSFSLPADYVSRSVGATVEGGCLWGTKDDLDRVTAVPEEGDFSSLHRGVFRARVSTNVICDPTTGVFDSMDGSGEAGIRKQFEETGASLVTWKKESLGGLPALQIVADLGASGRVYMLYLGNTRFSSNTLLVNYYQPKKRTAADDATWARFVAGIRKAEKP